MFGPDPIDVFYPSPYNAIAYYGHYVIGTLVLLAALIAFYVYKGRRLHRTVGLVYRAGFSSLG